MHDTKELEQAMLSQMLKNESFEHDTHLNELIPKPWGHEYRIFCNQMYDAWKLKILPGQETSMHCHPRKDTVLLCLEGQGTISYLDKDNATLIPGKYIHLPKGVYHSTSATDDDLHIVELENPRNKLDLLRQEDRYGRKNTSYETLSENGDLGSLEKLSAGMNTLIRTKDYENKFRYSLLSGDDLPSTQQGIHSSCIFFAEIDNVQHLKSDSIEERIYVSTIGELINKPPRALSSVHFLTICRL